MWGVWYSYNDIIMIIVVEILNMLNLVDCLKNVYLVIKIYVELKIWYFN